MVYLQREDETNAGGQAPGANGSNAGTASGTGVGGTSSSGQEGTSGAVGAGTSAGTTKASGVSAPKSQQFASFNDYIAPNSTQIANNAQTTANSAIQGLQNTQSDLSALGAQGAQDVTNGSSTYSNYDPNAVSSAFSDPSSVISYASDPNNLSQFSNYANAAYTGPQTASAISTSQQMANDAANAENTVTNYNSPSGMQQALLGSIKNPTPGIASFDTALFNSVPESRTAFAPIQNYAGSFNDYVNNYNNTEANAIANAQAGATTASTGANAALNGAEGNLSTNLTNELATANNNANAYNNNYVNAYPDVSNKANDAATALTTLAQNIMHNTITQPSTGYSVLGNLQNSINGPQQAQLIAQVQKLLDPSAYIAKNYTPITSTQPKALATPNQADVATPQEYNLAAALQKLGGTAYQSPLTQANSTQAGTFNVPTNTTLPTIADSSSLQQYMGDVATLYSSPQVSQTNLLGVDPATVAQQLLKLSTQAGSGVQLNQAQKDAYNRIIANSYTK